MSISNYPNGFMEGLTLRELPILQTQPGKIFWVNNSSVLSPKGVGGSDGNPGTFNKPFSTLDYAVGKCTASRGDVIAIMPGHAETISDATSLAIDVAGIAIVGIGAGTLRPTFTLDTVTTATIAVSAANVSIKNVIFTANFADIAELFTPSAVNLHLEDCAFQATAAAMNFISIADTGTPDNECDGLSFLRCSWIEPDLATISLVSVDGDLDGLSVVDCYLNLGVNTSDLPAIATVATGKDVTNLQVLNNRVIRLNDANPLLITADTTTANTGIVAGNQVRHLDTAAELLVTAATNIGFFENKTTAAVDKSGFLIPVADS
jgi:hypothetical protein